MLSRIPLRRRSSDWGIYWATLVIGILGGVYIWVEPLRELSETGTLGANDRPAPAHAPIPEHLQNSSPPVVQVPPPQNVQGGAPRTTTSTVSK